MIHGHLKSHPNFHHLDGRDRISALAGRLGSSLPRARYAGNEKSRIGAQSRARGDDGRAGRRGRPHDGVPLDAALRAELEKRSAWYRSRLSFSWRVDETYVRVKGRWKYLYRAIDKEGATLDFYLADRRDAKAAGRFLAKALRRSRDWTPRVINTDKNPAYGEAIAELKKEGRLPKDTQHRQVKYRNNRLEGGD